MAVSLFDIPKEVILDIFADSCCLDRYIISITCKKMHALFKIHIDYFSIICRDIARNGHINLLKWAIMAGYPQIDPEYILDSSSNPLMDSAAKSGSIPMIKYVRGLGHEWTEKTFCSAVKSGNTCTLEWMHRKNCPIYPTACTVAVQHFRLDILKWLVLSARIHPYEHIGDIAAIRGQIDTLAWLHATLNVPLNNSMCDYAAYGGRLKTLKWLRKNGATFSSSVFTNGVRSGKLKVVKWLYKIGCNYSNNDIMTAAKINSMEMLEWMYEHGFTCENNIVHCYAARNGNLHMIKWLCSKGIQLPANACVDAVANGHLTVATWMRENGCKWTTDDTYNAINNGDVRAIKWAHSTGGLRFFDVCAYAAVRGQCDIVLWAISAGFPVDSRVYSEALINGNDDDMKKYYNAGVPFDATVMSAAAGLGRIPVIEWLESVGCPRDPNIYYIAACNERLDVIKYAWERRWPYRFRALCTNTRVNATIISWINDNLPNEDMTVNAI